MCGVVSTAAYQTMYSTIQFIMNVRLKQERAATKQFAEFLEPTAEYYDDTQV